MLHGLGTSASSPAHDQKSFSTKLDTNSDNKIDRDEFIVGRPDDVSEDQAGALFDRLDSTGTRSLSQGSLTSAIQHMNSGMQSVLLQAQEENQRGGHHGGPPDPEEMFTELDTDADGTVTRDEFVAGRPKDVSEDQAGTFFDKIATAAGAESASGLSQTQLASGLESLGPPERPNSDSTEASSADEQLIDQLLTLLLPRTSQSQEGQRPDPARMFEDLDSDDDGTVSRDEFVAGRPKDVSEDQAGTFFDKIASAAGAESSSGLSQDQLAEGMKSAGPPKSVTSTETASTSTGLLLQELLKAIGSYQKANLLSAANTSLAA
jgi:Ca2+-binding EF-hand superfamily protein